MMITSYDIPLTSCSPLKLKIKIVGVPITLANDILCDVLVKAGAHIN
jgi:hypothetical protein